MYWWDITMGNYNSYVIFRLIYSQDLTRIQWNLMKSMGYENIRGYGMYINTEYILID